ncbi:MAG TPA: hypothetical protein VIG29_07980 [Vicinamibacteria bacterium]|jgi:hypothetical protein
MISGILVAALTVSGPTQPQPEFVPEFKLPCHPTSTVFDTPPKDPSADPFGNGPWYVNDARTLWAAGQSLVSGSNGNRILWIKPRGVKVEILGRRLDGDAPPLKVDGAPSSYLQKGFEPNRLFFSEPGCWEITATAGKEELSFVVEVQAP